MTAVPFPETCAEAREAPGVDPFEAGEVGSARAVDVAEVSAAGAVGESVVGATG